MAVPKYIVDLISTKKSRECCEQAEPLCVPVIKAFRFLIDDHGFRVREVRHSRREWWVSFQDMEKQFKVTLETEAMQSIYGGVCLMDDPRIGTWLSRLDFTEIVDRYGSVPAPFTVCCEMDDWPELLEFWAEVTRDNWSKITSLLKRRAKRNPKKWL